MIARSTPRAVYAVLSALFGLAALFAGIPAEAQPIDPNLPDPHPTPMIARLEADHAQIAPALSTSDISAVEYTLYLPLIQRGEKYPPANRAYELEVLRLVNEQRAAAGLWPLLEDPALTYAARRHAMDMAVNNLLSHTGSDGSTAFQRMAEEGFAGTPWTEAAGMYIGTPAEAVNGWMHSPYHRNIVLDRTSNRLGIGYAHSQGVYSWVITLGVYPKIPGM